MTREFFDKIAAEVSAAGNARRAMIDIAVRRLDDLEKRHLRFSLLADPDGSGFEWCQRCARAIDQIRTNYRQLYAEVYK